MYTNMLVYIVISSNVTIITLLKWSLWHSFRFLRWLLLSLFVGYPSPDRPCVSLCVCLWDIIVQTDHPQLYIIPVKDPRWERGVRELNKLKLPSWEGHLTPLSPSCSYLKDTRSCQTPTPCLRTISNPDEEVVVGLTQMTKVGKMKRCLRIPRHKWPGGERRGGVTAGTNVVSHSLCAQRSSKCTMYSVHIPRFMLST